MPLPSVKPGKPAQPGAARKSKSGVSLPTAKQTLGRWGEATALQFLEAQGYVLAERNWRCRYGEMDIIAWSPKQVLCFVEVRTRRGNRFGGAVESVTPRKKRRMAAVASLYLAALGREVATRFDVITHQKSGEEWKTEHFQDAFPMESL